MRRQTHLHFSRHLRRSPTAAERKLWSALRKRSLRGFRFNRQFRIGPYTVDFLCRAKALVVEVDGETHNSPKEIAHDAARSNYLNSLGYAVFRTENTDIYANLNGVLESLLLALLQRPDAFSSKAPLSPSDSSPTSWGSKDRPPTHPLNAVTSISIFMRGSASPTTIMVHAGRTSPNALPMAGQQRSKSAALVMR